MTSHTETEQLREEWLSRRPSEDQVPLEQWEAVADWWLERFAASATKIREEVGYKEDGKDEIYCNFWRCLRCDESSNPEGSNYCLKCGGKFKITLLPSEGESNQEPK